MRALTCWVATVGLFPAAQAISAQSFTVVERAVSDKTIDLGTPGDSIGDLLVFANPVFDATNRTEVGSDQGYCVRVVVGRSWECFWTLILKDGQITTEGPFLDSGDSVLTVTGGTGHFAGAKGKLTLHARDAQSTAYDFKYELL